MNLKVWKKIFLGNKEKEGSIAHTDWLSNCTGRHQPQSQETDALADCLLHCQPCLCYVLFFLIRLMVTLFQLRCSQIYLDH